MALVATQPKARKTIGLLPNRPNASTTRPLLCSPCNSPNKWPIELKEFHNRPQMLAQGQKPDSFPASGQRPLSPAHQSWTRQWRAAVRVIGRLASVDASGEGDDAQLGARSDARPGFCGGFEPCETTPSCRPWPLPDDGCCSLIALGRIPRRGRPFQSRGPLRRAPIAPESPSEGRCNAFAACFRGSRCPSFPLGWCSTRW
jgi:hypothetical protein